MQLTLNRCQDGILITIQKILKQEVTTPGKVPPLCSLSTAMLTLAQQCHTHNPSLTECLIEPHPMTELLARVLNVPGCAIHLSDITILRSKTHKIYVHMMAATSKWMDMCPRPEVLTVPDATKDIHFKHNKNEVLQDDYARTFISVLTALRDGASDSAVT